MFEETKEERIDLVAKSDGFVEDSDGDFPPDDLEDSGDYSEFKSAIYLGNSLNGSKSR